MSSKKINVNKYFYKTLFGVKIIIYRVTVSSVSYEFKSPHNDRQRTFIRLSLKRIEGKDSEIWMGGKDSELKGFFQLGKFLSWTENVKG